MWYYNLQSSFPKDKMVLGYFLDIVDNQGDNVLYTVIPVKYWNEILVYRCPAALARSVLRSRIIDSSDPPKCAALPESFKVYNRNRDELFGAIAIDPHLAIEPISLITNDSVIEAIPTYSTSSGNATEVSDHNIEGTTPLYYSLFVEKEIRSRPKPINLEEGEPMTHITSFQETFVT